MNKINAPEGYWYFNGEIFAREVVSYGKITGWELVTDRFCQQWKEEHENDSFFAEII